MLAAKMVADQRLVDPGRLGDGGVLAASKTEWPNTSSAASIRSSRVWSPRDRGFAVVMTGIFNQSFNLVN